MDRESWKNSSERMAENMSGERGKEEGKEGREDDREVGKPGVAKIVWRVKVRRCQAPALIDSHSSPKPELFNRVNL